jgi:hypothetical protein
MWIQLIWLPIAVPTWMVSFSLCVVLAKWAVVGRYRECEVAIPSIAYLQWWWVDRDLHLWEFCLGWTLHQRHRATMALLLAHGSQDSSFRDQLLLMIRTRSYKKTIICRHAWNFNAIDYQHVVLSSSTSVRDEGPSCSTFSSPVTSRCKFFWKFGNEKGGNE